MLPVLYFLVSLFTVPQQEWSWRVFPESGFKVLTPVALESRVTDVPTESKTIRYYQYQGGSVSDSSLALSFVIDHYALAEPLAGVDDTWYRDFFEQSLDEILTALDGTLVYMDFSSQADREVCRWKATYDGGKGLVRGECMLTRNQYYGLQVFGLSHLKPENAMQRFIDSFRLLELPKSKS